MTTTFSRRPIRAFARFAAFPALGITLALSLAACGDSGDSAAPTASPSSGATQSAGDAPTGGNVTPGVTGEIAAVTGSIAQVQDGDSQTAVTWTDTTAFKARVAGTVDDITVGSCVVASAGFGGDDATSSTEGDESSATFAASTVQVSEPVDGECTGGFGGGFGGGAPGAGGGPGSGTAGGSADGTAGEPPAGGSADAGPDAAGGTPPAASNGTPPDGASGDAGSAQRPSFGGMAVGVVTSIEGETVTVESSLPSGGPAADRAAATDGDAATARVRHPLLRPQRPSPSRATRASPRRRTRPPTP